MCVRLCVSVCVSVCLCVQECMNLGLLSCLKVSLDSTLLFLIFAGFNCVMNFRWIQVCCF